jgi:hypothetical protein
MMHYHRLHKSMFTILYVSILQLTTDRRQINDALTVAYTPHNTTLQSTSSSYQVRHDAATDRLLRLRQAQRRDSPADQSTSTSYCHLSLTCTRSHPHRSPLFRERTSHQAMASSGSATNRVRFCNTTKKRRVRRPSSSSKQRRIFSFRNVFVTLHTSALTEKTIGESKACDRRRQQ